MSAFEFFFSFYGLLLGLSVAVIATGIATAVQHRKKIRIGYLTPILAVFVGLDIATFWDSAWTNFRDLPFSYGLLIVGLGIALVYFIAASLVFPHQIEDGMSLDDHFWANKKVVLLLTLAANVLLGFAMAGASAGKPHAGVLFFAYAVSLAQYMALTVPAAFARKPRLFVILIGLQIAIFLAVAVYSVVQPNAMLASVPVAGE
ncbi:hypothetical protein BH10PSE1_BH10PSE1_18750 [soil metagenome]